MRETIEAVVGNHGIYDPRRQEFDTGQKIPFRVSPSPLSLTEEQRVDIENIGQDITSYFYAVDEMYTHNMGGGTDNLRHGQTSDFSC